jgi:hypothetical protein
MHASDTLGIDPLQPDGSDSDMARKKAETSTEGTWNVTPNAFVIKGTEEWKAYVERGATFLGAASINDLFDAAVVEYLTRRKFKEKAPERTARRRSLRD